MNKGYLIVGIGGMTLASLGIIFIALVSLQWHRAHPPIDAQFLLPTTIDATKVPPDLFPVQPHDVKG